MSGGEACRDNAARSGAGKGRVRAREHNRALTDPLSPLPISPVLVLAWRRFLFAMFKWVGLDDGDDEDEGE